MISSTPFDVLIIGTGAAGLTLALRLPQSLRVALLCKGPLDESATRYAQGGVAAVMNETHDTLASHSADTLQTGAGLSHPETIAFTVKQARESIAWLIEQGVDFTKEKTKDGQRFHLTQEGGHSHRRILHAADATGKAVSGALGQQTQQRSQITLFEYHTAIDVITSQKPSPRCIGCSVLNQKTGQIQPLLARFVVLATGGASRVYRYSTNPEVSSGDGLAMAWRAGCRVANMEFNQFHPTVLYHPQARSFLLTEALRGEGALLRLPHGHRFMPDFHPQAELAPRDIVARSIDHEMKRLRLDNVWLDISHKPERFIREHFPTINEQCLQWNIDITQQPIPVVPAAHYTCGGVMTDLRARTDIPGLYAIGEVAFTGLHGANRMASNSLLECLVFAHAACRDIVQQAAKITYPTLPATPEARAHTLQHNNTEAVIVTHTWQALRTLMWDYVGIVRSQQRLIYAQQRIALLKQEVDDCVQQSKLCNDILELRNLVLVAELIVRSALARRESRGLHYTLDYPDTLNEARDTVLTPNSQTTTAPAAL